MDILIKDGYIYDPANRREGNFDILVSCGKIKTVAKKIKAQASKVIDARGKVILPGLIDMHAHLREPGREDAETIETGLSAALSGGFTGVCAMPNTEPCCHNQEVAEFLLKKAQVLGKANLYPIGAITKNREGKELSEMSELKNAGCVAISDDGNSVKDTAIMRRALEYAHMLDMPVISHCEDTDLSADGVMHEGYISTEMGMKGMPAVSESTIVARDLQLAEFTGARIHIAHVSCKESLDLIRAAKAKGIRVTSETCPHYLVLTDETVKSFDSNFKMNPPLRTEEDMKALRAALKDGTIDVISTDHAPHIESEKDVEFNYAPFGIIGFETAVAVISTDIVSKNIITWNDVAEVMSNHPAHILGLDKGSLGEGSDADITIIDPDEEWVYKRDEIKSKSKNSPFIGRKFKGRVKHTIVNGDIFPI
ncbi:MAG: dihydroorotase [Candidatus Omnitrophica bacterium]|nr:dihydroorotase [Candidatus Omnitrophota bacterium]